MVQRFRQIRILTDGDVTMTDIQQILYVHQDLKYAELILRTIPTLQRENVIGVRSPEYRKIMKELPEQPVLDAFMEVLPHTYYEENILHVILLNRIKDAAECLAKVEAFLPYVDNWAVCDSLNPAALSTVPDVIKEKIPQWIASEATYTCRFGMRMTMIHFLDERFDPAMLDQAADLRSDEYYINMMRAWLFAEAMVKQWPIAVTYIENRRLDRWTHNKAIQKAIESYRITDEQKAYLRTLRVKK